MSRFVADENLNGAIVRGLLRRKPELDLVRVQDVGLSGISDTDLLVWAAGERRVILTHDITTLRQFAEDRIRAGATMFGLIEVGDGLSIRNVIEDLLLIAECGQEDEWVSRILFLPLR
jgi:hypothetical protein